MYPKWPGLPDLVKMNTRILILISIATKTAKISSHCDKHQLLYDVEISVWNLTVQKKFAMISYHTHWIGIENRMNMFRLYRDKNMDHNS